MGTLTKSYNYDALSRPVLIETDGGAEHIRYDAAGRIAEKTYPQTGRKKVYTYYENGTLKSLLTYREGELIGAENIEYDKNGNKTLWERTQGDGSVDNIATERRFGMKIIKPSFYFNEKLNGQEILKRLEKAGRICYKSEHKITSGCQGDGSLAVIFYT